MWSFRSQLRPRPCACVRQSVGLLRFLRRAWRLSAQLEGVFAGWRRRLVHVLPESIVLLCNLISEALVLLGGAPVDCVGELPVHSLEINFHVTARWHEFFQVPPCNSIG